MAYAFSVNDVADDVCTCVGDMTEEWMTSYFKADFADTGTCALFFASHAHVGADPAQPRHEQLPGWCADVFGASVPKTVVELLSFISEAQTSPKADTVTALPPALEVLLFFSACMAWDINHFLYSVQRASGRRRTMT